MAINIILKEGIHRTITNVKDRSQRDVELAVIISTDPYQFVLSEWELLSEPTNTSLELNGKHYSENNNTRSFHTTIPHAIKTYLNQYHIKNTPKNIVTLQDAVELYNDAIKELNKLLTLGK